MVGTPTRAPGRFVRPGVVAGWTWVVAWTVAAWAPLAEVAAADPGDGVVIANDWLVPLQPLALAGIGGLVLLRDPRHRYGWLMFGAAVLLVPVQGLALYGLSALVIAPDTGLPLGLVAAWLQDLLAWPVMGLVVLLLPGLFPDGRPVPGRWGIALWCAAASWVGFVVVFMLMERPLENWFLYVDEPVTNPTGVLSVPIDVANVWWLLSMIGSAIVALGSLRVRWRTAGPVTRQQITWPLAALVLVAVLILVQMLDEVLVHALGIDTGVSTALHLAGGVAATLFVVGLGLGVLRYRLYDVDRVINRTIVYGALTVAVFATYLLLVVGVGSLVPAASGTGLALLATAVVAVAFEPARRRLQMLVNRVMFGQRDAPYAVLARLGDAVVRAGSPTETLQTVVDTVAASLKLPWVAIELDQQTGQLVRAEAGSRHALDGAPLSLPLVHADAEVGRLLVCPRSAHEPLGAADRRVLADVAHQAGAVAATARLTLDLQRSREQLVVAREEERRRIRRDLHDGLGPALAAQTLALDAVADRIDRNPGAARDLVTMLKRDTQDLVAEIRRLVHELRPPALDELGLAGALVAEVAQLDATGSVAVRVRTEPDPLPDLSAAVEVATWRIVREAITNVLRHAEASSCTVTLILDGGTLRVRVVDDGVGLPVVPRPGVGLTSMRERAEELGGTCAMVSGPVDGTEVVAVLPVTDREQRATREPAPEDGVGADG